SWFAALSFVANEVHHPASTPGILLRAAACDSSPNARRPSHRAPRSLAHPYANNRGTCTAVQVPQRPRTLARFLRSRPTIAVRAFRECRATLLRSELRAVVVRSWCVFRGRRSREFRSSVATLFRGRN